MRSAESLQPLGARLSRGSVITTGGEQTLAAGETAVENPVLEMETAGIAQACLGEGVPVLAFRAVSDSLDQPLPFDLEALLDKDQCLKAGRILAGLVRDPSLLGRLIRFRKNAGRAAENCAAALHAALEEHLSSL